jgi:hypothetical protein
MKNKHQLSFQQLALLHIACACNLKICFLQKSGRVDLVYPGVDEEREKNRVLDSLS